MLYKSFPLYQSWCEIFGKDRATGEHAEDCDDATDSLRKNNNIDSIQSQSGFDTNFQIFGKDEEFMSICQPQENGMKIGYKYDVSEARKAIYEALGELLDLTMTQNIWVEKRFINNGKDIDFFFSLPNEA
ncbi:hypothetical protein CDL12_08530 [Handroanthus impetiginosus]|uniref:Uncharacterized protein n=1 Tax=Handroanthus impetiginosus TaxID=429701 RepID=A0A2G9HMX9_9LAMI|nr:hypothetical protein CDL12_08530 [Handroanthus impetiginosus]